MVGASRAEMRVARRWRRRRHAAIAAGVIVALLAVPAWSLGRVLLADNTDPLGVRVVEWARDHHLSSIVNRIENFWYTHSPPPRGGTPKGGIPRVPSIARASRRTRARTSVLVAAPPPNIVPFAAPLPGEGVWSPVGRKVGNQPVAWVTFLRPDAVHTSELIGVVHFNMQHLTPTLHAGTDLPGGGPWQHGARIARADYPRVVAAFNSAFKLNGSRGGYYAEGRTIAPLVDGRASFVITRDGRADIALWGRDATMTPNISSVRQNLVLLVDQGQLASDLTSDARWGATVGSNVYVWRSAVCVDAHADLVYAAGPALSVSTIAQVMQRAGCVRAMELDINSWWVSLMTFTDDGHGGVTPWKLLPSMVRNANRYLVDGTRDFFEIDAR
jgi:hypothetical protein